MVMSKDHDTLNSARAASSKYLDLLRSTIQERPQTDALYKLCNAIKGRQETANLRRFLHGLGDSNLKQPSGFSLNPRSALQKATSRLKADRISEAAVRSQLKEQSNILNHANRDVEALRAELSQKRRVALLLETLVHKEDIRLQRLSEIRVLIDELKKSTASVYAQELPNVPNAPLDSISTNVDVDASSYLQDTFATLHAHRIHNLRLSRQSLTPDPIPSLRIAIAKRLSLPEDDLGVQEIVNQFVARAKHKAKVQCSYHSVLSQHTSESDVDELSSAVRNQHKELQELSDLSISLIHLSQNYISSVHAFSTETLPVISNTLDESRQLVDGESYIGVLKNTVTSSQSPSNGRHDMEMLAEVCHPNSNTLGNVVDRVERTVTQCQRRADFIVNTLKPPEDYVELPDLITKYEESTSKADEYASTLLKRKAKKVEQAERLVRDIQRYIKDGKLLAGIE